MISYQSLRRPGLSAVTSLRMKATTAPLRPSGRLTGKVALVTASTEGIGLAIAQRLGEDGAHVVVSSRKQTNVDSAVSELEGLGCSVLGLTCHVAKGQDRENLISKTLEKFGGIDILVSNAAVNPTIGGVLDCPETAWDKIFEVNVKNALQLSQLVVPHMQQRGGGSIVYVSSVAGFQPFNLLGAYSVSKTALLGLTKAVAQQVAPDNIRVNCVAPGIVNTKFSSVLIENPAAAEKLQENILLGRFAEPKEMAGLVSFLCSSDASYITGETIVVAGGLPSRM
ncbi:dehydrogenase/reductase SDR family member 4-like [Homarus americanus]|uniref:dehydrogenase/reductase SDR family member 4-like n=1 Tax=Homarus americanus TaxID=6706 RepID=UPI001C462688|nr:dehydrogenase/reductase SDR family member 4-like [Homarus americanus]